MNGGGNRDKLDRPGNTPRFPPPHPRAGCRLLGVSPICSQSAQAQRPPLDGGKRIWVELGNLGWLWNWLENLPNLGSTFLTRREQAQTAELWVLQYPKKAKLKKKACTELCRSLHQAAAGCCTDQSRQASRSRSDLQRTDLSRHKQSRCLWKSGSSLRNAGEI